MEPKQNYLLVGIFVVLSIIGLFAFVVWLSGSGDKREYSTYKTYFTDSVTGLGTGASVKYRGVEVGKVDNIAIDTKEGIRIQITMRIVEDTPITQDTVAVLKMLGITGLAYVELEGGKKDSPPLVAKDDEIPVIASRPSELTQLMNSVPEMLERSSQLLEQLTHAVSEENIQHVTETLANISKFSASFGDSAGDMQKTLQKTAQAMEQMTLLLQHSNDFTQSGYRETGALLLEMKNTVREIRTLARDLKEKPSNIIIPTKPGGVQIP